MALPVSDSETNRPNRSSLAASDAVSFAISDQLVPSKSNRVLST